MAKNVSIEIEVDNTNQVLDELEKAIMRALEICGGKAETYAKENCPVDTGLLRNSITHALSGESPKIKTYKAERGDGSGGYSGTIGSKSDHAVYIGSNVEYALYNELHHKSQSGFLRRAVENHMNEYKNIIETELKNG